MGTRLDPPLLINHSASRLNSLTHVWFQMTSQLEEPGAIKGGAKHV